MTTKDIRVQVFEWAAQEYERLINIEDRHNDVEFLDILYAIIQQFGALVIDITKIPKYHFFALMINGTTKDQGEHYILFKDFLFFTEIQGKNITRIVEKRIKGKIEKFFENDDGSESIVIAEDYLLIDAEEYDSAKQLFFFFAMHQNLLPEVLIDID